MIKMIVAGDSRKSVLLNRGYIHESKEDYRICDYYCLQHNTGYLYHNQHITYDFAKRLLSTYRDCCNQQFE